MRSILSIQSHVAFGCVGNRAAVFPLQRLGHDVIAVNTVQFSNHTGYGSWTGEVFTADHIARLIDGIAERGALGQCSAVLSGYVGAAGLGAVILDSVARVREAAPGALYACDPVMGDVGRGIFVRDGIPEFFRERAVPAADIVTPNQFEITLLTGIEVTSMASALQATAALRQTGPGICVLTSLVREEAAPGHIEMLVDTGPAHGDGAWLVATPALDFDPPPNGAGDFVSAVFLAHYLQSRDPALALERVAAAIYHVLTVTHAIGTRELQVVAAQDGIVAPPQRFSATRVR